MEEEEERPPRPRRYRDSKTNTIHYTGTSRVVVEIISCVVLLYMVVFFGVLGGVVGISEPAPLLDLLI